MCPSVCVCVPLCMYVPLCVYVCLSLCMCLSVCVCIGAAKEYAMYESCMYVYMVCHAHVLLTLLLILHRLQYVVKFTSHTT
jgi:hypothetical protein